MIHTLKLIYLKINLMGCVVSVGLWIGNPGSRSRSGKNSSD